VLFGPFTIVYVDARARRDMRNATIARAPLLTPRMHLRGPAPDESDALLAVASASGLFEPGEVDQLLGAALTSWHAGTLGAGHALRVACGSSAEESRVLGWSYVAPAEGNQDEGAPAFELLWVGVAPDARRAGVGAALLADAERTARAAGAASLRIRTSTQQETAAARALYAKSGYALHGDAVPDYYGPGVHGLEFRKQLDM
jgi:GNAT superfamily N-acetyltransferase